MKMHENAWSSKDFPLEIGTSSSGQGCIGGGPACGHGAVRCGAT